MHNTAINQFLKVYIVVNTIFLTVQCKRTGETTFKDGCS